MTSISEYQKLIYGYIYTVNVCIPNEYCTLVISKVTSGLIPSIIDQKYFGSRRFDNADKFGNLAIYQVVSYTLYKLN